MRTTISLENDLLRRTKEQAARAHLSLSAFVANALREVLARRSKKAPRQPVKLTTVRGRLRRGVNYDSFADLLDLTETPDA